MIKAVIFDMDGVIVDSEPVESEAWERVLKESDKIPEFGENGLVHSVGIAGFQAYQEMKDKYELEDSIEILKERKRAHFKEIVLRETKPFDGFLSLIELLKKNKFKVALASNRFHEIVVLMLKNLKVHDHFETVVGADYKLKHKPAPDIYLKCAENLDLSPLECLAIEDTETGIKSAKDAGMKVIAVPNKYSAHHDFSKADLVVKSLSDIKLNTIQSL